MALSLVKAGLNEAYMIHEMQIKAFIPLLEKYQDYETSRIVRKENSTFRVSPVFILPEHQGNGFA